MGISSTIKIVLLTGSCALDSLKFLELSSTGTGKGVSVVFVFAVVDAVVNADDVADDVADEVADDVALALAIVTFCVVIVFVIVVDSFLSPC